MGANFGIAGLDWQQRVNWDRLREYRIERARAMMKKHGLGIFDFNLLAVFYAVALHGLPPFCRFYR